MATIVRSALVSFSAEQVFDVVNDVAAYPNFLPGCAAATVFSCDEDSMKAELKLGRGPVSVTFTTKNSLKRPESIILMLDNGPFTYFEGAWAFTSLTANACKVRFQLDFKMQNPLLAKAMETMMAKVSSDMVDAVSRELVRRYGQ